MPGLGAETKAATSAIKHNWLAFGIIFAVVIVGALWYEHKNNGAITKKLAGLPLVGKLFA